MVTLTSFWEAIILGLMVRNIFLGASRAGAISRDVYMIVAQKEEDNE